RVLHTYTSYIIGMQFGLFQFYQHTFGFLFLKKWYLGIVHLDHRRFQLKSYFHKLPQLFSKLILNPIITKNLEMHFCKQGLIILTNTISLFSPTLHIYSNHPLISYLSFITPPFIIKIIFSYVSPIVIKTNNQSQYNKKP